MDAIELSNETFQKFRDLVYDHAGISLSATKKQLLKSRLQRRLRALNLPSFEAYFRRLSELDLGDAETIEFINAITTNKTDFFRESHHFDFLTRKVWPDLVSDGAREFKVWHAGCSTGEEPYTLGIAFREAGFDSKLSLRQLATDIDTNVLAHAERGIYSSEAVRPLGEQRLRRWFLRGKGERAGSFKVRTELQDSIRFGRLNLNGDWPFRSTTKFDAIFCRNVLIYFDKETQKRLITQFHALLKPGGYLFLGHSESVHGMQEELINLGKTIYRAESPGLRRAA